MNKPVRCTDTRTLIETLTGKDYKENPIWLGTDQQGNNISVFVNTDTSAYTVIEFRGRIACVLSAGSESMLSQDTKSMETK